MVRMIIKESDNSYYTHLVYVKRITTLHLVKGCESLEQAKKWVDSKYGKSILKLFKD